VPAGYSQRAAPVGLDIRPAVVTYLKVRCAVRPGFPGERTGSRCLLATTASQARCPATGGLWNVRPPWHHEYRPEDVSGAHESRWLMIVDRVDVSYCEGWDSRTRAAVGPLSLALAEERHQAGEQMRGSNHRPPSCCAPNVPLWRPRTEEVASAKADHNGGSARVIPDRRCH